MRKTSCTEITPLPVSQKEEETKSQIPAGYNLPHHLKQVAVTTPKYFSLSPKACPDQMENFKQTLSYLPHRSNTWQVAHLNMLPSKLLFFPPLRTRAHPFHFYNISDVYIHHEAHMALSVIPCKAIQF